MPSTLLVLALCVFGAAAQTVPVPVKTEMLSKLESLVSSLAEGQDAQAPPEKSEPDVVIVEQEESNRRLKGGAMPLAASPNAMAEELEDEDGPLYVNALLQLSSPGIAAYQALPDASVFAAAIAEEVGVSAKQAQAQTAWGAKSLVRSTPSSSSGSSSATASVHVTLYAKNQHKKSSVEGVLKGLQSFMAGGKPFSVKQVELFPAVSYPLVCSPETEAAKLASAQALQQLVELKRQEVELLRAALTSGSQTCSSAQITSLANKLGAPVV